MTGDPFAPIGGGSAGRRSSGKPQRVAVIPIPADAPALPALHPKLGKPAFTWTYRDAGGEPLGFVHRFDTRDGKEFRPLVLFRPAAGGASTWRWESWPAPRPLYGLDRLAERPNAPVVVAEGEKAADAAARLLPDHVVVASPNGSKSAGKADWRPLKGRSVTVWPDADPAGAAYAATVVGLLAGLSASVEVLTPPRASLEGWDAADALAEGWDQARALDLLASARPPEPAAPAKRSGRRRTPQRDQLMDLTASVDLWHGVDGEAFASFPVNAHRENWPIRSQSFKRWLASRAYEETGLVPGAQAVEDTLRVLEARATNDGAEQTPWLRSGSRDGRLYLDLADAKWRAIEITPHSWRILETHDLPFVRSQAMRQLPVPEAGESVDTLRRFINVASDEDFVLVVAWLVAALRDRGPYPILVVNGEQGSGKSTFTRLLRSLVDPNAAPIRAAPRDDRDLIIAAMNSHVLAMDNLSKVDAWLADGLCRLATGGGFSTRMLHTDKDELVFMATRPIILNGIPQLTDRPDLADRAVNVRLSSIPEGERQAEDEFWRDWEETAPMVLGALCDALSAALRKIAGTRLERSPRLADFAKWVTAAEGGLGWEPGVFLAAYSDNRRDVSDSAFEADPVAVAIHGMMKFKPDGWAGTATELLFALNDHVSETMRKSRAWPITAQGLGNRIDRIAPLLRGKGLLVERRHSGVRTVTIVHKPN